MSRDIVTRYNTIVIDNNEDGMITTYEKTENGYWSIMYTRFGDPDMCPIMGINCPKEKCPD